MHCDEDAVNRSVVTFQVALAAAGDEVHQPEGADEGEEADDEGR